VSSTGSPKHGRSLAMDQKTRRLRFADSAKDKGPPRLLLADGKGTKKGEQTGRS